MKIVDQIYRIYCSMKPGLYSVYEIDVEENGFPLFDFDEGCRWVKRDISLEECILIINLRGGKLLVGDNLIEPNDYYEMYNS